MKKIIVIILFFLLITVVYGQDKKRFDYKSYEHGSYLVYPTFDNAKGEGNYGQSTVLDQNYLNNLIYNTIKDVFPKQKIDSLHLSSGLMITFNPNGKILYCKFIIDNRDKDVITEDELYNLYIKIKKLEIDMTKVKIDNGGYPSNVKSFDYSEMVFSLLPIEYRKNIRKSTK